MKKLQDFGRIKHNSSTLHSTKQQEFNYLTVLLQKVRQDKFARKNYAAFSSNNYQYTEDLYDFADQTRRHVTLLSPPPALLRH